MIKVTETMDNQIVLHTDIGTIELSKAQGKALANQLNKLCTIKATALKLKNML